ncbi:MAG: hypothetical protein N3E36_07020 [Sulfolobales archaeon]|nr:hypothetical protein [Ignisphaera sp.]MCX8199744.1 hypothetical protein [Sulfolobales archaeon]MDW8085019.1 hypothetical protein [Ignisphaera sp.]
MIEEYESILFNIPNDLLKDVEEYEEKEFNKQGKSLKRRYPSNQDIAEAIKEITGGFINRHVIENLYDTTKRYLEEKGFDISILNENRFWRLVTNLVRKKCIQLII